MFENKRIFHLSSSDDDSRDFDDLRDLAAFEMANRHGIFVQGEGHLEDKQIIFRSNNRNRIFRQLDLKERVLVYFTNYLNILHFFILLRSWLSDFIRDTLRCFLELKTINSFQGLKQCVMTIRNI